MAKLERRIISGARVHFDPRTTAEAHASRDMTNYKAQDKARRTAVYWERRRQKEQKKH